MNAECCHTHDPSTSLAEEKYGFKIYQGGVVPVKSVRIVSIEDFDVEACGGTHVKRTKEIELIKITRTKRIQDGVVRIEFVSGDTAQEYVKQQEIENREKVKESAEREIKEKQRETIKQESREKIPKLLEQVTSLNNTTTIDEIEMILKDSMKICFTSSKQYDEFFHTNFGKKLVKNNFFLQF